MSVHLYLAQKIRLLISQLLRSKREKALLLCIGKELTKIDTYVLSVQLSHLAIACLPHCIYEVIINCSRATMDWPSSKH